MYFNRSDALRYSSSSDDAAAAASHLMWPSANVAAVDPVFAAGIKRSADALYHETLYGAHSTMGQSEAWYPTSSLVKRPRLESVMHLPIYPQRPGEKDCAHYMLTRTCKFGDICKFDHPIWVPEGGIPDWKEVPPITVTESLPERPGMPDCPYFMKTQRCKFAMKCKFNHPKEQLSSLETADVSAVPERPSEPPCAFYMKTGTCKFGITCKFHHPKDIKIPLAAPEDSHSGSATLIEGIAGDAKPAISYTAALIHNSKGLPIRPGEMDCPFYLKTGSCKYGATCRYNHPERIAIIPLAAATGPSIIASPATTLNLGFVTPAASIYQTIEHGLTQPTLGVGTTIYPQRPGQTECDHYMKTGVCRFGETCKFDHPLDRSTPSFKQALLQNVKLTLAGLPRREGVSICPYYLKTGTCKYGATCKFDHPPPVEVMAMASSSQGQATSVAAGGEAESDQKDTETR